MSFSTITSTTGTEYTGNRAIAGGGDPSAFTGYRTKTYGRFSVNPVALGAFVSAAVNNSIVDKPMKGWITYSDPGCPDPGGGSERPATGMLYPRGF